MIRLGGYLFDGPRLLGGWDPPPAPAVYAVLCPAGDPERYAVVYVGHCESLAAEGFPFAHSRAAAWIERAGSRWRVHVATLDVPGGTAAHRESIATELIARYRPRCNA